MIGYPPPLTEFWMVSVFGMTLFLILVVWDLVWKGIALWKCGRSNQLPWFVAILIVNSAGILPIIYLLFFQKKKRK